MTGSQVRAAIYARVSSDKQAEQDTIASQVAALQQRCRQDQVAAEEELSFLDGLPMPSKVNVLVPSPVLASVADLVQEINIADGLSTDRTREIAASFGARIIDFPWVDSFSAARNASMRQATGQYVFWMDGDDRLDVENRNRLRSLFASLRGENVAYVMKCLCLPDHKTGTATLVDHLRLFRRHPNLRWTYRVHEQILPSFKQHGGEIRWSDAVIHHTGYIDPVLRLHKRQRDLRLLQLEYAENPEAAFTLFNLGSVYQDLGRNAEALELFRRSLQRSTITDSIVRKLYALIAQCHNRLDQKELALAACQEGRGHFPEDRELLFQEGLIRRGSGDRAGAIACWEQTLAQQEGKHFASVNTGLAGYLTRANLGSAYYEAGRKVDAEGQWLQALREQPGYEPVWRGLTELYLRQQRWTELEGLAVTLQSGLNGPLHASVVRARGLLAQQAFAPARQLLAEQIKAFPDAGELRVLRSYVLLQEGKDWEGAEQALRDILWREPANTEARQNLNLLLCQQGRAREG